MLKKVFLAASAAVILAGATMTMAPATVQAVHSCHKADNKKACKAHHRAYKKAHKKHHFFKKK